MGIKQKLRKWNRPKLENGRKSLENIEILVRAWILGLNPSILRRIFKEIKFSRCFSLYNWVPSIFSLPLPWKWLLLLLYPRVSCSSRSGQRIFTAAKGLSCSAGPFDYEVPHCSEFGLCYSECVFRCSEIYTCYSEYSLPWLTVCIHFWGFLAFRTLSWPLYPARKIYKRT